MTETLIVDDLTFAIRRSGSRRTVGITVERDGSLTMAVPVDCDEAQMRAFAEAKRFWIYTKLAEKEQLFQPHTAKEYVPGEGFYYLGRSYRLKLVPPGQATPTLRLHQGWFELRRDEVSHGREHFVRWYREHGLPWLGRRVDLLAVRIGMESRAVKVQDLGFRWGSCSANGTLNCHWRSILLPLSMVEYVVAHELAHLREPHHTSAFWATLGRRDA